ncbi:DUF4224 domain-containing protein [Agarivorans sp. B2Z047]|uniref:DUF4224 domain-containing protein n=1 Tax=Agarivorans sp. B2Z047 TaxID=2652721 RepID=UPI00128E1843|nr:DUF4224 domain-containing protein [Agarivorans sp. B2Z047]
MAAELDYEFVPDDKLVEFTGYSRPAEQSKFLSRHGIFNTLTREGKCRLTWYHLNHPNLTTQRSSANEPDFSKI